MGRTERPLEPANGASAQFAAGLRELRRAAGSPPYRLLAERAHYSPTALSEAAAGRKLPTLEVTLAYVAACGGDSEEWECRWREAVASGDAVSAPRYTDTAHTSAGTDVSRDPAIGEASTMPTLPTAQGGAPKTWRLLRSRRKTAVGALAACAAVLTATLAAANTGGSNPPGVSGARPTGLHVSIVASASASASASVYDAVDPKASGCANDGATIATRQVTDAGGVLGVLELRYSPHCQAGWARYTPIAAGSQQVALSAVRATTGTKTTFQVNIDQIAAYTDVLSMTRGCVAAAVTVHLGQRMATVTTACSTGAAG